MKQCCEYVKGLRYKLRMMGIPVKQLRPTTATTQHRKASHRRKLGPFIFAADVTVAGRAGLAGLAGAAGQTRAGEPRPADFPKNICFEKV